MSEFVSKSRGSNACWGGTPQFEHQNQEESGQVVEES